MIYSSSLALRIYISLPLRRFYHSTLSSNLVEVRRVLLECYRIGRGKVEVVMSAPADMTGVNVAEHVFVHARPPVVSRDIPESLGPTRMSSCRGVMVSCGP